MNRVKSEMKYIFTESIIIKLNVPANSLGSGLISI